MGAADDAITEIRAMILAGSLAPGDRLPREEDLAETLGISRNSMREAVRALEQMGVLAVRHGSGTFVSSLEPAVLLEGLSLAVDLMNDSSFTELTEVRRILEPAATRLATIRMTPQKLEPIVAALERQVSAASIEELVRQDLDFHAAIVDAAGNATLSTIHRGISGSTIRQRIWGGIVRANAADETRQGHLSILTAIQKGDPELAHSEALVHVNSAIRWLSADSRASSADIPGAIATHSS